MAENLPALATGGGGYSTVSPQGIKGILQALRDHPNNPGDFVLIIVRAALSSWRSTTPGTPGQPLYNFEFVTKEGRRARLFLKDDEYGEDISEYSLLEAVVAALIPDGFPKEPNFRSPYNVVGARLALQLKFENYKYVGYEFEQLTRPPWMPPL